MNVLAAPRAVLLGLVALLTLAGTAPPAFARHIITPRQITRQVHFAGKIVSVGGQAGSPTSITVQTRNGRLIAFRIPATCTIAARTAEAEVEGPMPGDFAAITAHRANQNWVADTVTYDVARFVVPRLLTWTGTIVRVAPDLAHFLLRLENNRTRWVRLAPAVRIKFYGQPAGVAVLMRGQHVAVTLRRTKRGWVALEIDIEPARHPLPHLSRPVGYPATRR